MAANPIALQVPGLPAACYLQVHGSEDRYVSHQLRENGIWEPFETEVLLQTLKPDSVFLDVGANLGYFSVVVGACLGSAGRVIAVEPEPNNACLLRENLRLNGIESRVTVAELAFSDCESSASLYISRDNFGDHQLHDPGAGRPTVSIDCVRGADWLADHVTRLDLVKIDVQGSEFQAVAGLMPLLKTSLPELHMLIELSPRSLRLAGHSGRELIELLSTLGLRFAIVDHLESQLVATDAEALARWCDNIDTVPDDEGFMNIYLCPEL